MIRKSALASPLVVFLLAVYVSAIQLKRDMPPSSAPHLSHVSKRTNPPQADDEAQRQAKAKVDELLKDINKKSAEAASNGLLDREKYVIPPHLHDLQEADLPETQRGLVMTEIAQFRERAAKREREKMRDVREQMPNILAAAPSGPKVREWGKPQAASQLPPDSPVGAKGFGKGAQGYSKPVGFVKAEEGSRTPGSDRQSSVRPGKTDEELEQERKEARRRDEENSYRDVSAIYPQRLRHVSDPPFHSGNADMNPASVRGYKLSSAPSLGSGR